MKKTSDKSREEDGYNGRSMQQQKAFIALEALKYSR
jgi:hypothetical protein